MPPLPPGTIVNWAPYVHRGCHVDPTDDGRFINDAWCAWCYTFVLAASGTIRIDQPRRQLRLSAGRVALVEPGTPIWLNVHSRAVMLNFDIVRRQMRCDARRTEQVVITDLERTAQPTWREIFGYDLPDDLAEEIQVEIAHAVKRIAATYWDLGQRLRCMVSLAQLVLRCHETWNRDTTRPEVADGLVEFAERIIEDRLRGGLNVGQLARACKVSRTHLAQAFRRDRGHSPSEAIDRVRLERCRALFRIGPQVKQQEVATRVGFSTASAFSAWFRRYTGQTPTAFRRRLEREF